MCAGLEGYIGSGHVGDEQDWKSTAGMMFLFIYMAINSIFQKRRIFALSSCEAEYIALRLIACQSIWMKGEV